MTVKAKIVVLSAVAAMVMGVVACGGDAKKADAPAGGDSAAPAASGAPAADSAAPAASGTPAAN